jgi:hypothetical protein
MPMTTSTTPTVATTPVLGTSATGRWRLRWAGYAACAWSLIYMVPHLYWAAGGTELISVVRTAAPQEPEWQLINGVASAMLTGAAVIAFILACGTHRRLLHGSLLAIAWAGCVLSVAHGIYGIADRTLIVAGVRQIDGQSFAVDQHGWVLWDLLVFEPWFLIEGVLFGLAGWVSLMRSRDRRRWVWLSGLGVVAALAAALLQVRVA